VVPDAGSSPAPGPVPPLAVVGPDHPGPVDVDTGDQGREGVAATVAAARMAGARTVRTREPAAARRAAHVVDAIAAARPGAPG